MQVIFCACYLAKRSIRPRRVLCACAHTDALPLPHARSCTHRKRFPTLRMPFVTTQKLSQHEYKKCAGISTADEQSHIYYFPRLECLSTKWNRHPHQKECLSHKMESPSSPKRMPVPQNGIPKRMPVPQNGIAILTQKNACPTKWNRHPYPKACMSHKMESPS